MSIELYDIEPVFIHHEGHEDHEVEIMIFFLRDLRVLRGNLRTGLQQDLLRVLAGASVGSASVPAG
jgi:hypothetical protein